MAPRPRSRRARRRSALLKALAPERDAVPPGLKPFLDEGEAAHQALGGYRRLAQASSTDALRLLADVAKIPVMPVTDLVRRDTLEQHALLAAHEAAVMAARTRAEAERLRAILAEARLATAEGGGVARPGRSAPGRPRERGDHAGQLASRRCRRAEPDRGAPGRGGARSRGRRAAPRAGRRTAGRLHREAGPRRRRRRAAAERRQRDALGNGCHDRHAPVRARGPAPDVRPSRVARSMVRSRRAACTRREERRHGDHGGAVSRRGQWPPAEPVLGRVARQDRLAGRISTRSTSGSWTSR